MDIRALLVAFIAVVALAGVALAAESQSEEFLHQKDLASGFSERDSVSGNLVALTGILVALGVTLIAMLIGRAGWKQRLVALPVVFLSTYLCILMLQTGMFHYVAEDAARSAIFAISPIISNGHATPSTFILPIAGIMTAAMGLQLALRRLAGTTAPNAPTDMIGRFLACILLATPFVGATLFGNIRLLIALPHSETATVPYLIVLPLAGLAAAAMLVVGCIKLWQLVRATTDPRFSVVAQESWEGARRAEWAILGVITLVSLLSTVLEPLRSDVVEATAFNLNVRTHSQAQIFLLLVFLPWMAMHGPTMRALEKRAPAAPGWHGRLIGFWLVAAPAIIGGGLATFLFDGALWAWLIFALPLAIYGLVVLRPRDIMIPSLLAVLILWGIGNTVNGFFQLNTTGRIAWDMQPGLLALWRTMAVVLVAITIARSARGHTEGTPRALAWPMTAGLGAAAAAIVFFELPFSAWIIQQGGFEHVGIGTVVASQDPAVRAVLHGISGIAAFLGGLAFARIQRPDWFAPRKNSATSLVSHLDSGDAAA